MTPLKQIEARLAEIEKRCEGSVEAMRPAIKGHELYVQSLSSGEIGSIIVTNRKDVPQLVAALREALATLEKNQVLRIQFDSGKPDTVMLKPGVISSIDKIADILNGEKK